MDEHRVEAGLPVGVRAADGRRQVGHDLVERPIGRHLVPQPAEERVGRLVRVGAARVILAVHAAQFAPQRGHVVGEVVAGEQGVDPTGPLVGRRVGHEGLVLLDRWRPGGEVERDPPQEGLVVAELRRHDPQLLEPLEHEPVDEVVLRWIRPPEALGGGQHDHLGTDREPAEAGEHRRVARPLRRDTAAGVDLGHARIVRAEEGQGRDVAGRAVGVGGRHQQSLGRSSRVEDERRSRYRDSRHVRHTAHVVGRPGLDPGEQRLGEVAVPFEPLAAGVGHGAGGLEKQEALRGGGRVHPPTGNLLDRAAVVAGGIEPEQREHVAILAAGRAVAGSGIASGPEEDRHHVAAKPGHGRIRGGRHRAHEHEHGNCRNRHDGADGHGITPRER